MDCDAHTHVKMLYDHYRSTCVGMLQSQPKSASVGCGFYVHIHRVRICCTMKINTSYYSYAVCKYTLCLFMHLVHNDRAPSYLADIVTATAILSRHTRLPSASSLHYNQEQGWNSASSASRSLVRRLGILFCHPFKNCLTLKVSNTTWKLFFFPAMLLLQYLVLISFRNVL